MEISAKDEPARGRWYSWHRRPAGRRAAARPWSVFGLAGFAVLAGLLAATLATPAHAGSATTTTLTSSANPANYGAPVTLSATVTAYGDGAPTGSVDFYDGATKIGTGTLDAKGVGRTVAAGGNHSCVLTDAGGVKCWGDNLDGQLGDGTTTDRSTPYNVVGLASGVKAITNGSYFTCALTVTGGVKCWGSNWMGQIGDGSVTRRTTPVDVIGLASGVAAITAGGSHTCALTSSGGARCWGYNIYGELGDGSTTGQSTPVEVSGLTSGVVAIAAGAFHTCALNSDGGVRCWGSNGYGQVGDGSMTDRSAPVAVSGLTSGVVAIATGQYHTCALTSGGGVKCWGFNGSGELGDGTSTDSSTPVDVSDLPSGVAAISSGGAHTCALTISGGIKCWGWNGLGQLGDGTKTDRSTPVDASTSANNSVVVTTGFMHTCAETGSGGVRCWGYNHNGQLGDGTTTDRSTPVDVSGLSALVQANASFVTSSLAVGIRSLGATFAGDANHSPSSDSLTQTVAPVPTTTSLSTSKTPTVSGESVTFTVAVSGAGATPIGTVDIAVDGSSIGTATLSGGSGTLTTSGLAVGSRSVVATYAGDDGHAGSTSATLTQGVSKGATTTATSAAPSSASPGETVTFTATVTPTAPASGTPGGTVTFSEGETALGTVNLSGGSGALALSNLAIGSHSVVAAYSGNGNFEASTAAAAGATVTRVTSTTTLSVSPAAPVFGESVTLTATVTGTGTPAGSVDFSDGATLLGSAALSGGSAGLTTSALAVGAHSLTATYGGDASNATSTSPTTTTTVAKGRTAATLVADTAKILPGGTVTLTATLAATGPATGTPGGDVAFKDGATVLGTVTLASGSASLATTALTTGDHTLVAAYQGSGDFEASNSSGTAVSVDPRVGAEFRVNTVTAGSQQLPAAASLKAGGFVTVWTGQDGSGTGIFGQRHKSDGAKNGAEFRVNTLTADAQSFPAVAGTVDGGFATAWVATAKTGKSGGIWGRRWSAAGAGLGNELRLDATAGTKQSPPAVAARSAGGYVAAWISNRPSGSGFDVFARVVDGSGKTVGGEIDVATTAMATLVSPPAIAPLTGGGYVVVWASATTASAKPVIKGQRLTAAGGKAGGEFAVTAASFAQGEPVVAGTADGGFVVAWTSLGQDGSGKGVYAQRYGAAGAKAGATFRVTTTTAGDQAEPSIAARPGGGFTVAWTSGGQDGSGKGVYAQRFDASGTPVDVEFRLNTTTAKDQSQPSLVLRSATDFLAAWTSLAQDGSLEGVYGQRFSVAP